MNRCYLCENVRPGKLRKLYRIHEVLSDHVDHITRYVCDNCWAELGEMEDWPREEERGRWQAAKERDERP